MQYACLPFFKKRPDLQKSDLIVIQVFIVSPVAQPDFFQISEFLLTPAKTDDLFEFEQLHSLSRPCYIPYTIYCLIQMRSVGECETVSR